MKRHAIAFLVHPFKNSLVPKAAFREAVNSFAQSVLDIGSSYQNLRFNLVMPGYFLEAIDPMLLLALREMHKKGSIEWLTTGYTEPFLSFSPQWLLSENLKYGVNTFVEYSGARPSGFVPPFSNWEPSYIDTLRDANIHYAVLSRSLLPPLYRTRLGYWVTEFAGSSTVLFPAHSIMAPALPGELEPWIEKQFALDTNAFPPVKILCIDFLCPLMNNDLSKGGAGSLADAARVFDKLVLSHQPIRFTEFLSSNPPLGLQYIPQSVVFKRDDSDTEQHFLNTLHSFDQAGIIQRKMMDVADNIAAHKESRHFEPFKKTLFFVQDINRYIPAKDSGFMLLKDRMWCYEKLIDIEHELRERNNVEGGQIRIADFLRNGSKSIIMTNKNLAVYIDHKNGGHIFELDVRRRRCNVCAGYNPARHALPMVIEPGLSHTAFIDHFVPLDTTVEELRAKRLTELGDFVAGAFEYKIKKTDSGIKAALNRQGSVVQGEKTCPLSMEKVLGLEKDHPALSYAYQLSNHSLTPYAFRLAIEITFSLPGVADNTAFLLHKKEKLAGLGGQLVSLPQVSEFHLADPVCGVRIHCSLQKPMDLWCFPAVAIREEGAPHEGVTIVLSSPVTIDGSDVWSCMGKIQFKRLALSEKRADEI
jgi:4-alpha-glucanotransferase